jgi:hypothetical protein
MTEADCPQPGQQGSAVLTVALTRLRSDFNEAFPARDKGSDGWIGDTAHQESTSGHNPDDTSGVSAEYSDSDSKAEVRAIDVDKDLKSTVTMQDVIDRVLATANDLKRLKYIIFNRYQWSKSNGWKRTDYYGSNPHDKHGHFSGDPAYDEDGSQWSVATIGEGMTDAQAYIEHIINYRVDGLVHARDEIVVPDYTAPGGSFYAGFTEQCQLAQQLHALCEQMDQVLALLQSQPVSESMMAGVLTVTGGTLAVLQTIPEPGDVVELGDAGHLQFDE